MKKYTFHISSSTTVEAETEKEAREHLLDLIAEPQTAFGEDAMTLDDIVSGAEVGELLPDEDEDDE
jgi:hypothetical protein